MRPKLTERQQQVLDVIRDHIRENGISPSHHELTDVMGFASTNAIVSNLKALAKKGYITWEPNRARTIRIIEGPWLVLPLAGEIQGGRLTAIVGEVVDFSFLLGQ